MTQLIAIAAGGAAGSLVGLLGGFTTFSAFSMETITLIEQGASFKAALYIVLSVSACLTATWLGIFAARQL